MKRAHTLETEWGRLLTCACFRLSILAKDDLTLDVRFFLDRTRGWAGNALELDIGGA